LYDNYPDQGEFMSATKSIQLSNLIDSSTPGTIFLEVKKIFSYHYPKKNFVSVNKLFELIKDLFLGNLRGYRACNTEYHNFSHTIDALLAVTRLIDGYNLSNAPFDVRLAVNLLNAALLHDTGYLQESWDVEGTGAKYTSNHVERSEKFLLKNYRKFGIYMNDVKVITSLIRCTGLSVNLDTIQFNSPDERVAGCILGTSDLLGQMSDRAYLEKLLFLYYEFKEAGISGFNTEFDIIRKTIDFYDITMKRLNDAFINVMRYAQTHFRERFSFDMNLYLEAIDKQMAYLHKILDDDSTNFRHKLKRGKWIKASETILQTH
jgi:hypothetical protein